ncbi:hypothetical protein GCM10009839_48360 [Catenulispora yoronensis]|uniref:tRNAHis guanylyltransferase catalytic domain-containing protein n=1 Tax=Catenulispora yoronensis TaxID=450799 RepID=A0ABP5G796_9ACTN
MNDRTGLGDRMKAYEAAVRTVLPPRGYSVIRVDGRAFHTLLRGAPRPFDPEFMAAMDATGVALCEEIQGAAFGYVQSDEVSVLVADATGPDATPWFGGEVQKQVSIAAAVATAAFNASYRATGRPSRRPALFDARVFPLPDAVEVANCFVWRQRDAMRNSLTMVAEANFPAARLHGVDSGRRREMLAAEHGVDWEAYPDGAKRGRVVVRTSEEREVAFVHKKTGEPETAQVWRSWWEARAAPHFTATEGSRLAEMIPVLPNNGAEPQDG